jgi:ribonucleoside-diphosphate reductase alpha chain
MKVTKRDGSQEPVDLNKILKAIRRHCANLTSVDPMRVAQRTINGLYDGAATKELDKLSIQTASSLVAEEPEYSRLAARLLSTYIDKEVDTQDIDSFHDSVSQGFELGLINARTLAFVKANKRKLNSAVDATRNDNFEYFGLRTVYDRYLLKNPKTRQVIETPQYFFMRVAAALSATVEEAIELYHAFSSFDYMPSTPTLFNSGTVREQLSSCYLLDSPEDDLSAIYEKYKDIALLSKFSGGIGVAYSRVRSRGSLIKGTNGYSNGIVPWLKTLDSSVNSVNQCFAPETTIFTSSGSKKIQDVKVGELVLGATGEFRKVTSVLRYPQKEAMVEIFVKHSSAPLRVTSGHPLWAIKGVQKGQNVEHILKKLEIGSYSESWIEAGEITSNDFVGQVVPTEVLPVDGFTKEDARFYGLMLGDGHMAIDQDEFGISVNPLEDQHIEFVRQYLESKGIHYWETARPDEETYAQIRWAAGRSLLRDATTGQYQSGGHCNMPFDYSDLYRYDGSKAISKRFMYLDPNLVLSLIQGLVESDGGIYRSNEIHFYNKSEALVEGLRFQLLRLGVPSTAQRVVRAKGHTAKRSNGKIIQFPGNFESYDLRIPAIPQIAEVLGVPAIRKRNWFVRGGCVWSRVKRVRPLKEVSVVYDLKVEGVKSYMTQSVLAHNGGKRKGAACVYLEPWHADIEEFLSLRDNTGDEASRTHNLNLANWVPDIFMERVDADADWSLFDPKAVPQLSETFGTNFRAIYEKAEADGLSVRKIKARDLYARMMRTLAETGNGWMTFKDACNVKNNQTNDTPESPLVHSSNLCTEITEVSNNGETAVCNLASVNLSRHIVDGKFDFDKLGQTVKVAVRQLDRVIDINFYPIDSAATSNLKWRPVGLGVMGLQDALFMLGLPFDSEAAQALSVQIAEEIYYHALSASCDLAEKLGKHPNFYETRAAKGVLQFDLWGQSKESERWVALKDRIKQHGLRNSLLIAIAPTATIASIVGCYECVEPQTSNLFKRETLSGDFLQVNRYLVTQLKGLGLWTEEIRDQIKVGDGSIQGIAAIPEALQKVYRTVWEVPQRSLIDMAAARGAFIDQSASLNLFMESPKIGQLSSMYFYAWKKGLKTTYYLRSRPATKIAKATTSTTSESIIEVTPVGDADAIACSLENPEACEACQ